MRAAFLPVSDWVLDWESGGDPNGGDHTDPTDPGKRTKWGISSAAHPEVNLDTLDREGARAVLKRAYWDPLLCDEFPFPLDAAVFDSGVNQGNHVAALLLQALLPVMGDGIMGPTTVGAATAFGNQRFVAEYLRARARWYIADKAQVADLSGWLDRLFALALALSRFDLKEKTE